MSDLTPTLLPLGDSALLVRFANRLSDEANRAAIALAAHLGDQPLPGVLEIAPNLVSVLVRYDPLETGFADLSANLRLLIGSGAAVEQGYEPPTHTIGIHFGGEGGPDLESVASSLRMNVETFILAHNTKPLRVLATGFAPGFVYCGLHDEKLNLPRRTDVRRQVPAGTVLFAAGQTAITATPIPTGWHVIGTTDFRNFDPAREPPVRLAPGGMVQFKAVP